MGGSARIIIASQTLTHAGFITWVSSHGDNIAGSTRSLQGRLANTLEMSLLSHPTFRQPQLQLSFCLLVYIKSSWLLIWFEMYSPVGLSSYFSVLIFNCWGIFVHMLRTFPLFSSCCISLMLYLIVSWSAYIFWTDYASRCVVKSAFILLQGYDILLCSLLSICLSVIHFYVHHCLSCLGVSGFLFIFLPR